jgi:hypothetical protein
MQLAEEEKNEKYLVLWNGVKGRRNRVLLFGKGKKFWV